jgi:hypothetical protein
MLVAGLGLWGARQRRYDLNIQKHALVVRPDMRAASWLRQKTDGDGHILINSFPAYGGNAIAGSDGGWWLPLLAGRQVTIPPLNYGQEASPWPDYPAWINALNKEIQQKGINHPDVLTMLEERNINQIYLGQQQGQVNNPSGGFTVQEILSNPNFEPIYHQDRVWIFQVQFP